MKKFSTLLLSCLLFGAVNAQGNERAIRGNGDISTQTRQTADYDKISISNEIHVELIEGKEGAIKVSAESNMMDYIVVETEENELKIYVKKGKYLKHSGKILVTVPVQAISELSMSGSGDVNGKSPLKGEHFKISSAGSGSANLAVEANTVKASLAGSGNVHLNGKTTDLECSVAGSGNISAENLKAKNVKASVAGSGNINVNSSESVKGSVSGSGNIQYTGSATKVEKSLAGSGNISKM